MDIIWGLVIGYYLMDWILSPMEGKKRYGGEAQ